MGVSSSSRKSIELTGTVMVVAIAAMFVFFIFILFLHLYAKWFIWRTEEPPAPPPASRRRRRQFVFVPGQETLVSVRKGLDPKVLGLLPVITFDSSDFKEGLECAVCLSDLEQGEKARLLPKCNHGYHVDCIDMWFQSHSTCPVCRNLVSIEISDSGKDDEVSAEEFESSNESLASLLHTSSESLNIPANVLYWGNHNQVSNGESQHSSASSSFSFGDRMLVIDIPEQVNESFQSSSPSRLEEECKSPLTTRFRSLKRLLSREKKYASSESSSSSIDA